MFKKPDGKTGFSFRRLISNAVPNSALDAAKEDSTLTPKQQDDLFAHQIELETPQILDNMSLLVSGIVESRQHSKSVLASLKKVGIVSKTDGSIHTELITKHFANQVPEISIHRQRRLVGLLFFWEEECTRWRLLDEEEAEIRKAMAQCGDAEHEPLKIALGTVWVRRSAPPSQRGRAGVPHQYQPGASGEGGVTPDELPPGYRDTKRSVSISGGKYHGVDARMNPSGGGESSTAVEEKPTVPEGEE